MRHPVTGSPLAAFRHGCPQRPARNPVTSSIDVPDSFRPFDAVITDPAILAWLAAVLAVVALIGWGCSVRRAAQVRERAVRDAGREVDRLQGALAASEIERARLEIMAARLPQLEASIERLSNGVRAGADELRRLRAEHRQQSGRLAALQGRHRELVARLQVTQVRLNEAARLLAEAQAQNRRLEEELAASARPRPPSTQTKLPR